MWKRFPPVLSIFFPAHKINEIDATTVTRETGPSHACVVTDSVTNHLAYERDTLQ